VIVISQDEQGLRLAAAEMLEDAFEAPQREENERIAAMSSDPEAVLRATLPKRSLSPGYYLWLVFLIEAVEQPMEAGVVMSEAHLGAEELLGLQVLRGARAEFRRKHPPCRRCGTPLRYEHQETCNECQRAAAAAARSN